MNEFAARPLFVDMHHEDRVDGSAEARHDLEVISVSIMRELHMLYVITGANQATGAKTRLEIEAANRASAERAAKKSGIEVLHCHAANEDPVTHPHPRANKNEEVCEGKACAKLIAIGGLVIVALLAWILL